MTPFLENVLSAHGSLKKWKQYTTVSVVLKFGGLAFRSKLNNKGSTFRLVDISTKIPVVFFNNFPTHGLIGVFSRDEVRIETIDGIVLETRTQPRDFFKTFRRTFYWDDLDLLYFAGYACWNYFNSPFMLASDNFIVSQLEPWKENGQYWNRLLVRVPDSIPTHSTFQTFYFDNGFLITRVDYRPTVFAKWARAAHYCYDYIDCSGLKFPMRREVFPNTSNGTSKPFPKLVWIEVAELSLK